MDAEKPAGAHQHVLGDASRVSAAGVHAANAGSVGVNHQPLAEEVTRAVGRCTGQDAGGRVGLADLSIQAKSNSSIVLPNNYLRAV